MPDHRIEKLEQLRSAYGEPSDLARRKALSRLDEHCRRFIENSPFLVLATSDASGTADASPRGDQPGFVMVVDDTTLLIPDRPGNRRVDSLSNVVSNPHVGLLFFVPGVNETLRINGTAAITTDEALLNRLTVRGRIPKSALIVSVGEAFLHCAKALIRSDLWNPDKHQERRRFPTLGKMLADQIGSPDPDEIERHVQESIDRRLY